MIMRDAVTRESTGRPVASVAAVFVALVVSSSAPAHGREITAGWEDVCTNRWKCPPAKVVWRADMSSSDGFTFELRDGATGEMRIANGNMELRKTNDKGYIVVKAPSFHSDTNVMLRLSADVACADATPEYSHAFLRAHGEREFLGITKESRAADNVVNMPEMTGLINTAPGMTYRKYFAYRAKDGLVRPVIVVAGDPSNSRWSEWTAEDFAAAKEYWVKNVRDPKNSPKRLKPTLVPDDEFDRMLEADIDHTAKIEPFGGVSRMLIDGRPAVPCIYLGMRHLPDYTEVNDGLLLHHVGVPVIASMVPTANAPEYSLTWTKDGFDAKKAASRIRETMRASGDALAMISLNCNAYSDFVRRDHPGEGWIDEKGRPIIGDHLTNMPGYGGMSPDKAWPWVSMASRAWREAVNSIIRDLVAELKRRNLSKRIVGVHFWGYDDGQFGMNRPDYSEPAKMEYRRYLAECGGRSTNYWHFCRQMNARLVEEFGGTFKRAMGKDVIVLRRCNSPFVVDFAFGANMRSGIIDVTVSGPAYDYRAPGLPCTTYVPFSSLSANGKMLWNEFDIRTWWIRQGMGVVQDRRSGCYTDIENWRAGFRKLAGEMLANRGGYWFYDMGRGWCSGKGIPEDIGDVLKTHLALVRKSPSPWRPEVAIVVDEEGFFGWDGGEHPYPNHTYELVEHQLRLLATAGVPYEYFLAEDAILNPERLAGKKAVFLLEWRKFDEQRIAFVKELRRNASAVVFLGESGVLGERDGEATGFNIDFSWEGRCLAASPEPGMEEKTSGALDINMVRSIHFGENSKMILPKPCGRRATVKAEPDVVPLARFDDGTIAIAERRDGACKLVYVSPPGGLSPGFFNRIAREAGAYVPVPSGIMQVNMNGDFISIHALKEGCFDFALPFSCMVRNVKTGKHESVLDGKLPLRMTAGETCWFLLEREDVADAQHSQGKEPQHLIAQGLDSSIADSTTGTFQDIVEND